MHGHALSGSRKLNRHWQSGGVSNNKENLILLDKPEIVETHWEGVPPYFVPGFNKTEVIMRSYWSIYDGLPQRTIDGFKPLVITRPGDYQLHWNLKFIEYQIEYQYGYIVGSDLSLDCGMYACVMHSLADENRFPSPISNYDLNLQWYEHGNLYSDTSRIYCGGVGSYVAHQWNSTFDGDRYSDNEYNEFVRPSRQSTYGGSYSGNAYCLNNISNSEDPPIIFHIGQKYPFKHYDITYDQMDKIVEVVKDMHSTTQPSLYYSPNISLVFGGKTNKDWVMIGKIWIERIGDYTDEQEGWYPFVKTVPQGWTSRVDL